MSELGRDTAPIVYLNRIATAVPPHDVHNAFLRFARSQLEDTRARAVFDRMASKAQIEHRFSVLPPAADPDGRSVDGAGVYAREAFATTASRMQLFEKHAPLLAARTVAELGLGLRARDVTHLIVTSCTGMYAPGIDLDLIERCGLSPSVERTVVGFMGCYAAINALKLARHIVRSEPHAQVLIVNIELCSLHLQETRDLEQMLSLLAFADGCAASLVTAQPEGLAIDRFHAALVPDTRHLITWKVGDSGFEMFLSGRVPQALSGGLAEVITDLLEGGSPEAIQLWAVHPGGRSILDAVEHALLLNPKALLGSREVLRAFGNMSSATMMFVLQKVLADAQSGERGCALAFGPGLSAETMLFHKV